MQLFDVLGNHQARNYDAAQALLEELIHLAEVAEVEDWEQMARVQDRYRYPMPL